MKIEQFLFAVIIVLLSIGCHSDDEAPVTLPDEEGVVIKTNSTKLYMHYMPWFHTKDFSGYWGIHWTMANQNPDNILTNGNREIAAHYYPLIGPYDSSDPDVIDYHLLLMKYAGIDGILIDWYGTHDVWDYGANLANSNALIEGIKKVGLEFGIVYEEFTTEQVELQLSIPAIDAAQQDINYMEQNYFNSGHYIHIQNDEPLLLTFGPRYFTNPMQWSEIFQALDNPISFLPLWFATPQVGNSNSSGEFAWVDFTSTLSELDNFYQSTDNDVIIGSAYPGFHDFYEQGGWGDSYGLIDHQNGETLEATLAKATQYNLDYLQLVTWNDFGEGTMIEPTQEFQFHYLEQIQDFAGVEYDKSVLEIIHDYYLKRKAYEGDAEVQSTLDDVFDALNRLDVAEAENLLSGL